MRIDFQLATPLLTPVGGFIDVEERSTKGASDHAPVVVDYEVGGDASGASKASGEDTP